MTIAADILIIICGSVAIWAKWQLWRLTGVWAFLLIAVGVGYMTVFRVVSIFSPIANAALRSYLVFPFWPIVAVAGVGMLIGLRHYYRGMSEDNGMVSDMECAAEAARLAKKHAEEAAEEAKRAELKARNAAHIAHVLMKSQERLGKPE